LGATLPTVGRFSLYKSQFSELCLAQPRTSCRSLFKQLRDSTCSIPIYTFINELHYQYQEHFPTNSSMQGTRTIFVDQIPTCLVFKKIYFVLPSKFLTVYHVVWQFLRKKRQNLK